MFSLSLSSSFLTLKRRFIARVTLLEKELVPFQFNPDFKRDFLESFDIGPNLIPCILRTVKARQDHLHITFRDFNEEHKEESIHQHCIKNKHPHTKQNRSFLAP
jgi:hypothetical protein